MKSTVFACLLAAAALPCVAQTAVTGVWSGTYSYSVQVASCSNKTFTASGNANVTLLQTGSSVSGRMDISNFLSIGRSCTATTIEATTAIVGSVGGSTVMWTPPNDPNSSQFVGTISTDTMNVVWTDNAGASGRMTLTRANGAAPSVDITGSWAGTYNFTDRCSNNGTQTYSGATTLGLTQSGSSAGGVVTMKNVPLYDQNCKKITSLDMAMQVAGNVSGSTFIGGVIDPSGSFDFPITATVSGTSMNGTVNGASQTNTTGTFTLTQSSNTPPAATSGGTYEGTYSEVDLENSICLNIGTLTYGGDASLTLTQAGNNVSGWLTLHDAEDVTSDGYGTCFVVQVGDEVLPVYGTIVNNTLTMNVPRGGGTDLFTFNVAGDTVTGTLRDPAGDVAQFSVSRTTTATPLVINRFTATPLNVVAGQPATLTWSTSNATSVSIDNGLGTQATTGSITVFPTQTTPYTLTATGVSGTKIATVTVNVFAPGRKRRVVKPQ